LGLSPTYGEDATILAGAGRGLFISHDGGDHWRAVQTPMPDPTVLCFCFSPNYRSDGIILAGTLEDGIYFSDSRGERWSYRGFGLQDAAVYSLAISPDFARDETIFAGAESALYYSYNGARAWKLLDFPEEAAPILSLALSPDFAGDHTLFAGTELHGLYQSTDRGKSWQKTELPATSVNALAIAPEDGALFAATNAGLFCSDDEGARWECLLDRPDAFCLAVSDDFIATGLVDQGAWLTADRANWQPFFTLTARPLTGMVLSPHFDVDSVAFLYGPQEGIWRTTDGGHSWTSLNEHLPNLDIQSLALSPTFLEDCILVAASGAGLLISEDGGEQWSRLAETPASLVAFAPDGKAIAAANSTGEIWLAQSRKGPWQPIDVPWSTQGQALALSLDDNFRFRVALLDRAEEMVSIWAGQPGHFAPLLSRPAGATAVIRFWPSSCGDPHTPWYASVGHQVWEFRSPPGSDKTCAGLIFEAEEGSSILALTGSQISGETGNESFLFASTGQTLYRSTGTKDWDAVYDFGDERAIDLALSPTYSDDATVFALLLGGSFWRGILK
jgi:photosystem II stability/assembly factor-like uncharacterized protein